VSLFLEISAINGWGFQLKQNKTKTLQTKKQQITLENKRIKTRYLGGGFFDTLHKTPKIPNKKTKKQNRTN